jgi:hypothetical protein
MTRDNGGRFAPEPISRIGRQVQRTQLEQRAALVRANVAKQAARLPREPAQFGLKLACPKRAHPAMSIFDGLGPEWSTNGDTATLRLDDGRLLGIWLGEKIVEVSCRDLDGVVFVAADHVDHLISLPAERMADAASALVGKVIVGSESRAQPGATLMAGVMVRHSAVAARIKTCAGVAGSDISPVARQLVRRLVKAVNPFTPSASAPSPIGADVRQELAVLQLKLYDLSKADMSPSVSTGLGNMIGALLSDDDDQQRRALGWT